ncbi:putative SAM-dependent MTase RsmB/NOP-type domain-containing protein [Seiridium cardinale]
MGRKNFRGGRKGGNNRGGGGPRGGGGGGGDDRNPSWRSIPAAAKQHEKLERYYNTILPLEDDERSEFWDALKKELPNSFRFAGSKGHALAVKRLLEERYAPEIVKIERFDGEKVEAPQAISWYPDQLAYSMNTPKHIIRKFPPFAAFQKFLVSETSVGNISRQEIVSMIPPLLMDVKPGHTVLDLCAAPGSKSAQLVEMIHKGEEARIRKVLESFGETQTDAMDEDDAADLAADPSDDGRATGLLIANDAEYKRCHMLVHQLKRLSSPNILVTNHDATLFPAIRIKDPENPKQQYLKFDRILADVPCSGDGTMRKNMNLWKDWQPGNALGLHTTQVRILIRALQMLKVGGRVVYSTCSMNPVENEAVVLSAIERCGGPSKIDIIDCSDRLPGLKRKPGMFQWQIMDKTGRIWNSWEEVKQHMLTKEDGAIPGRLAQTMFPRSDENECSGLPLDRCMRVYAHQQDTGGFFITVLEKKGEVKVKPESAQKKPEVSTSNGTTKEVAEEAAAKLELEEEKAAEGEPTDVIPANGLKRTREEGEAGVEQDTKKLKTEDVVSKADEIMAEAEPIAQAENADALKTESASEVATPSAETPKPQPPKQDRKPGRNADGSFEEPFKYLPGDHEVIKTIRGFYNLSDRFPSDRYMVRNAAGEPAKAIYYTSALLRDILVQNEGRGIKFVHGGVKMFMKQDSPSAEVCRWRIQSEGMPIIEGYVGPERVIRLTNKDTFHKLLKEMFPRFSDDEWVKLGEIGEAARDIGMGCCVLRVEPDGSDPDFSERMALPLWKSFLSLNLMLPKEDRAAMLLRIFNDTTPVINLSLKESAKKDTDNAAEAAEEQQDEAVTAEALEKQQEETAVTDGKETTSTEPSAETKQEPEAPVTAEI